MRPPPASATPRIVDWYDYPQYYDLLFQDETRREVEFIEAACQRYCPVPVTRLLEPGCGSGRLIAALAARGYHLTGLDLNPASLKYAQRRLGRRGLGADLQQADMTDFRLDAPCEAAYCTMNTFRHLLTETEARNHLQCVARTLVPGGIYILGFHLLPPDVSDESLERWTATRGRTKVHGTLRVLHTDRRARLERLRVSLRVRSDSRDWKLRSEFTLRRYTAAQFRSLLASVPDLELRATFDFCYDLDEPLPLDNVLTDAVFILQRRARSSSARKSAAKKV